MPNQEIFAELSLVLVVVAIVAVIMRTLRQPLILGYIIVGILVGPAVFNLIQAKEAFEGFSQIGIALLLFIIGLGMNLELVKNLGKVSLVTAGSILLLVGGAGFGVSLLLGLNAPTAFIIGISLFFSSTIVILKVLSDKRQTTRLHAQVAIGVILVDDIVATIAILCVAAIGQSGGLSPLAIGLLIAKAIALGTLLFVVARYVVARVAKKFAKSQELLFLAAVAWAFGVSQLFSLAGFSHEVGALFAGVSLASLPYAMEMSSRLKPLRDFFIVLFFVHLGELFVFHDLLAVLIPAIVLSLIVLIGKPLFVMSSLGSLGYTKLTSFKAAIHLSQISEFSIVLVVFAAQMKLVEPSAVSVITLVALITIAISSYLMHYDDALYRHFAKLLSVFERKTIKERKQKHGLYSAVLFGYHHGGHEFLQLFRDTRQRYLIVDYNPEIIEHLEEQGIRHAYGDATDSEFLEEINLGHAKFIASTIIDATVNKLLLAYINRRDHDDTVFICHAHTYEDALELYDHGATYVILPRFIGSEHFTSHVKRYGFDKGAFKTFRQRHIMSIGKRAVESI